VLVCFGLPAFGNAENHMMNRFVFGAVPEGSIHVSILQLIVTPKDFDCKSVKVSGLFALGPEGPGYLFPDTRGLKDDPNRISISIPEGQREQMRKYSGFSVVLAGEFNCLIDDFGEVLHRGLSMKYLRVKDDTFDRNDAKETEQNCYGNTVGGS